MLMNRKPLMGRFLAALILFGQSIAIAHESGHDLRSTDEYCVQCLAQSVFENKCVAPVHPLAFLSVVREVWTQDQVRYHARYLHSNTARSPPISLS